MLQLSEVLHTLITIPALDIQSTAALGLLWGCATLPEIEALDECLA